MPSELLIFAEILFLFAGLLLMLALIFSMLSFAYGAPLVASGRDAGRAALRLARLKPGEKFYDLGSGDGRVVFAAAAQGADAVGIEINPLLWLWSSMVAFFSGSRARFVRGNFFSTNLRDADVVFIYTWQGTNEKIEGKLQKELKKGARVVSHCFSFAKWKPAKSDAGRRLLLYKRE